MTLTRMYRQKARCDICKRAAMVDAEHHHVANYPKGWARVPPSGTDPRLFLDVCPSCLFDLRMEGLDKDDVIRRYE